MAWEWSHSAEALEAARQNVQDLPKDKLLEILSEWQYHDMEQAIESASNTAFENDEDEDAATANFPAPSFDLPDHIKALSEDVLADSVWERMESLATCSNRGHLAWCCPDGCHTVSFDLEAV